MSTGTEYLDGIAQALRSGRKQWRRGDNLLYAFGYVRRRQTAIELINAELRKRDLVTDPEITTAMPLDGYITFYRADQAAEGPNPSQPTVEEQREAAREATEDPAVLKVSDVSLTVANLDASDREPVSVSPNATIAEALTRMELNKYSQLVVQTTARDVKGTVSFRSIARAQLNRTEGGVHQCLDEPVPRVALDTPLLEVVGHFRSHDAVLVFGPDRSIRGIVTPADIAAEFGGMAEPFLLIGEIENLLRWLIVRREIDIPSALEKVGVVSRVGPSASVSSDELTLGEMQRLLDHDDTWAELGVPYHRKTVCEELDDVRRLRNAVMHFREPLTEKELAKVRSFQLLLKRMCESLA